MSSPADPFVGHCLDLLSSHGPARARRMFGGHGLYVGELFVAIVVDARLYLKTDAGSAPAFAAAGSVPFTYRAAGRTVALNFGTVPEEAMESPALMAPWVRLALQSALGARTRARAPARTGRSARREPSRPP